MEKPREIAIRILRRYAETGDYLENLLERELSRAPLGPADRALVRELTFGIVRWQSTLDWLIGQKAAQPPQKKLLQILLRLGLYQLFFLDRIPVHAAVHETVELAKQLGFKSQAGFINAILRGYVRQKAETEEKLRKLKLRRPALGYSHPDWLVTRWQNRWGEETCRRLLEWNNSRPPLFARVNSLKITPEKLTAEWQHEGVQFTPREWDWTGPNLVFELQSHPVLNTLPSFKQGWFYIQDPSTLLAVGVLDPRPGERILDLCAAPGGKTTFIAQHMENRAYILAQDVSAERLNLVRENCARLGVTSVETQAIGSSVPAVNRQFDRILIDAPCSNTGVMRRRVDLRWRIRPEEITRLRRAQLELLQSGAEQVKKGGTLVYSTCSLEPEENAQVVKDFLTVNPSFSLSAERVLLPFVDGVDGAYVARMCLKSSSREAD